MKKLFFIITLLTLSFTAFSQAGPAVQYSDGNYQKARGFNGGAYFAGPIFLGRYADTTAAFQLTKSGNKYSRPAREGALIYDSSAAVEQPYIYRGDSLKYIALGMVTITEATIDFGSVTAQTSADSTVSVAWARVGDPVSVSVTTAGVNLANTSYTAFVSAAGTVTVRLNNYSSSAKDPASGVFRIAVTMNNKND